MPNPEADRLAEALRAATKSQCLSGADLAKAIERLTGERPSEMTVSRWLRGEQALIRVSPHLAVIAAALGLDPVELACDAIRQADTPAEPEATPPLRTLVVAPHGDLFVEELNTLLSNESSEAVHFRLERDLTWTASRALTATPMPHPPHPYA